MKSLSIFCLIVLVALTSNNMMKFHPMATDFCKWDDSFRSNCSLQVKGWWSGWACRTGDNYNWSFKENFWRSTLFWFHFSSKYGQVTVMFSGQRKETGLVINVFIITALGQVETKVFTCILISQCLQINVSLEVM